MGMRSEGLTHLIMRKGLVARLLPSAVCRAEGDNGRQARTASSSQCSSTWALYLALARLRSMSSPVWREKRHSHGNLESTRILRPECFSQPRDDA